MSHKNLSAFTLPKGSYPAYISVNFTPATVEPACSAFVTIDVRGHAREQVSGHMHEGPTARIVMTPEEFRDFLRDMAARALAEGLL
jgi:hypothetical protein